MRAAAAWAALLFTLPSCGGLPGPDVTWRLQGCAELTRSGPTVLCTAAIGRPLTVEINAAPGIRGALAFVGPGGDLVGAGAPFELALGWRGAPAVPPDWHDHPGHLELLAWRGPDPAPGPWSRALRPHAQTRVRIPIRWERPFAPDTLPAGSDVQACLAGYLGGDGSEEALSRCRRAWADGSLRRLDHLRVGNLLGLSLRRRGALAEADGVLAQVLAEAEAAGELRRALTTGRNRADVLTSLGRPEEAVRVLSALRPLAVEADDPATEATLLRKVGDAWARVGGYTEADLHLQEAIQKAHDAEDVEAEASARMSRGILLGQVGDPLAGLEELAAAAPIFTARASAGATPGQWEDVTRVFTAWGWLRAQALRRGLTDDTADAIAAEAYRPALEATSHFAPDGAEARDLRLLLADLHRRARDLDAADAYLDAATAAEASDAPALALRGESHLARGRPAEALAAFETLAALSAATSEPDTDWAADYGRARAFEALGRPAEADLALGRALSAVEATARAAAPWTDRGGFIGEREEVFRFALDVAAHRGDPLVALAVAERGREVSAAAEVSRARLNLVAAEAPAALVERRAEIDRLQRALLLDPAEATLAPADRRAAEARRGQALRDLRRARDDLARFIEAQAPAPAPSPALPADPSARLAPGEAVLVYAAGLEHLYVWLLQAGAPPRARRIEARPEEIRALTAALRPALAAASPFIDGDTLPRLSASLLGDGLGALPAGPLTVVPWGPLYHVPFALLEAGGAPLYTQRELAYAPSLTHLLLGRAAGDPPRSGRPALVVGDPTRDLAASAEEARAVAARLPGASLLLGDAAGRDAVLAALPGASLFHFAGHAAARGPSSLGTQLVLAEGGRLSGLDLLPRPLHLELAVLSGCETAGGVLVSGGDLRGITRDLLYAGTRGVLATLWPVRQGDAAPLLAAFYDGWWDRGEPPRRALAEAVRRAATGELGLVAAHPRVWAGFTLWGR